MLQTIRDWIKGWLALGAVIALTVPFAFWGINYYFGQGSDILVAKVNGTKITVRQYQRALEQTRERFSELAEKHNVPYNEKMVKRQTINSLITRALLAQAASDMHLHVGNGLLRKTITSVPAFQGKDGFDRTRYEQVVNRLGMTIPSFELELRSDMNAEQLEGALSATAFVTDEEVDFLARLENEVRDIRYAMLSSDAAKDSIKVTPGQIKTFYDQNSKLFMIPEKIKISYIMLSVDQLAKNVSVTDQALKSYYQTNKANYTLPGQRKVSQLLVPVPKNAPDKVVEAAHDKAEQLEKEVKAGKSMKELAEASSAKGGPSVEYSDFGYLAKGVLEPPVDKVVFQMSKGEVSAPIRSKYGFHVMRVEDVQAAEVSSFEDARAQVEKDYRHAQAEKRYNDVADKLTTLTYEHPDTLEFAANKLGLKVQTSDWFSRQKPGSGLLKIPKVLSAAFSDDVLNNGNNSDVLELDDNHSMVLRVSARRPAHKKPLEDVREDIVTRIKYRQAKARTEAKGEAILKKLRGGETPEQIATSAGIQWKDATGVTRDDPQVNRTVLDAAFRAGRPKDGKPVYNGVPLGTGDYAVVQVSRVHDPKVSSLKPDQIKEIRSQLEKYYSSDVWTRYLADLRQRADIEIYKDKM